MSRFACGRRPASYVWTQSATSWSWPARSSQAASTPTTPYPHDRSCPHSSTTRFAARETSATA
eukprot:6000511-Pleurochrysis_carterae.AAC.1